MFAKLILSATLLAGLGLGTAMAQTTTDQPTTSSGGAMTRDPAAGDPGNKPTARRRRQAARQDAPAPGATNGNAPDRAMAGGGGR